jgi:hypothetical protein
MCQIFLVLQTRIELVIHPYHGCVIPLNYKSVVPLLRFELRELLLLREMTLPICPQGYMVPLEEPPHSALSGRCYAQV